jgi:hypothetical protein
MDETRRAFLVVGGGAAIAALALWAGAVRIADTPPAPDRAQPTSHDAGAWVDVDGWMLSPDDHARLVAEGGGGEAR